MEAASLRGTDGPAADSGHRPKGDLRALRAASKGDMNARAPDSTVTMSCVGVAVASSVI